MTKKQENPKVLVTSGWLRSTWAIARNLAKHGLEVHVGDFQDICMTSVSKHVRGSFKYPAHDKDPEAFVASVIEYIIETGIGTYIPSHEEGFVVAKFIDSFPERVKIPVGTYDQIMQFHLKGRLVELAQQIDVPTPFTCTFQSKRDFLTHATSIDLPAIVKKQDSNGAHGVAICRTANDLTTNWEDITAGNTAKDDLPVIQEYLENKTIYAASALARDGEVLATFVRRNLREKEPFGGACVRCESVEFPEIVSCVHKLIGKNGYTGVCMFEFLVDDENPTSDYWLIDANPRYWGTTSHAIDCGVEFPYLQYCMANDLPLTHNGDYALGKRSRWIVGDVISFLKRAAVSDLDPRVVVEQFLDLDDDFFMDLKPDDLKPFVVQALLYYLHRDKIL